MGFYGKLHKNTKICEHYLDLIKKWICADTKISEPKEEAKVKDETIENLQDKLIILENFKTKVINFISKISNLIPNFNKLLNDEPTEVKNKIKDKYSRDGMEI